MEKVLDMKWARILELAEHEVANTLRDLPKPVGERIRNVPIILEQFPTRRDIVEGIEADTLGFFDEDSHGLARIRLWLENIWSYADGEEKAYLEEIRLTLLHEIGHALGWDEGDIESRGL